MLDMRKPTYYIWCSAATPPEEIARQKNLYAELGFRVVTFFDGDIHKDINDGLKALIKNHIYDNTD